MHKAKSNARNNICYPSPSHGFSSSNKDMRSQTKPYHATPCMFCDIAMACSLHTSLVAHQAGAYPGFSSMKRLGVFLLPPGWDASPSQGYPQHQIRRYPFIHLDGERHCESEVSCLRTQHNVPGQGSNPERSLRSRAH